MSHHNMPKRRRKPGSASRCSPCRGRREGLWDRRRRCGRSIAFTRRVKTFSKGMRQRLGIAIAIMKNAQAVLLDEPTSGLDPKGGADFLNLLRELKEEGKAIFMSTHDIFRAKEIADRIGILVQGNLERELTRDEIQAEDLEALYLHYVAGYEPEEDATE